MADEPLIKVQQNEACKLDFGEFFINEVKTKQVVLTNNGEFNFDFLWKRQPNKNITITPESGTVQKGGQMKIQIKFSASSETELKNYKSTLTILSGPKYDFNILGSARKPGVRLN
jgi:hydrocephalus-inducing protein